MKSQIAHKRPFHLMAKPASFQCNLACDYCFYLDKEQLIVSDKQRHMSDRVLSAYVKQYIEATSSNEVEFTWQGGEPTLAGLDFYKKALDYQQKYAKGKIISNSIQTNGVLLNDSWGQFLSQNNFLVGISIDGPKFIHDHYRKNQAGRSSFSQVMQGIDVLKKYEVPFNTLTVVHSISAQYAEIIYPFLTETLQSKFLQFIPIVEQALTSDLLKKNPLLIYPNQLGEKQLMPWSVMGIDYGKFLVAIFKQWVKKDIGTVFIQMFDNTLAAWLGLQPSLCTMQANCGFGLVIEQEGSIYSCDHYVYPEYKLGNLLQTPLEQMAYSKKQRKFGTDKSNLDSLCLNCSYRFVCHGGCPKHRIMDIGQKRHHNHLCDGYKYYFSYVDVYMTEMAKLMKQNRPASEIMSYVAQINNNN